MRKLVLSSAMLFAAASMSAGAQAGSVQAQPAGVTAQSNAAIAERAKLDGQIAATNVGGWYGRSWVVGFTTGLIGTGVIYTIAASSSPDLPTEQKLIIASESAIYQAMYEKGYTDKVKSKRKSTALKGGLLGTVGAVGVILLVQTYSGN